MCNLKKELHEGFIDFDYIQFVYLYLIAKKFAQCPSVNTKESVRQIAACNPGFSLSLVHTFRFAAYSSRVAHECHSKNFNKLKLNFVFIIKLKFFS